MSSHLAQRWRRFRQHGPEFLALEATPRVQLLCFWWLHRQCIPRRQDAPILVYTMGKVGTISLERSLRSSGLLFTFATHRMRARIHRYPHATAAERSGQRCQGLLRLTGLRWLRHGARLRIVTAVREPVARLVSLYLYNYRSLFGEPVETAELATLLARFPRILDEEFVHPLIPGEFFANEIERHLGIDVYAHPFSPAAGGAVIEQGNRSLLVLRTEDPDESKVEACRRWLGRDLTLTRSNTAGQQRYGDVYEEFKRRVRIPWRYAEAIHRSRYLHHFYSAEERAAFWRRWEPQLDASLPVPAWVEASLARHHPPVDGIGVNLPAS